MRSLVLVFIGVVLSFYWLHPVETHVRTDRRVNSTLGRVTQGRLINLTQFVQPKAGQFDASVVDMFYAVFPPASGSAYIRPDSSNTRIEWLSWSEEEGMVLIETDAGYAGGSCGRSIIAGMYNEDENTFVKLLDECGVVDTVFHVMHNGVCDFSTTNKWGENEMRYQFNGRDFTGFEVPREMTDEEIIEYTVGAQTKFGMYDTDLQLEYVVLDSTRAPYIFGFHGLGGTFLFTEISPHEFSIVNFFENGPEIDISNTRHNGMPDIQVLNTSYKYELYHWNGSKYMLVKTWDWVCPA